MTVSDRSALDVVIDRERERLRELQNNARELLSREQDRERRDAERRFDDGHADVRERSARERREIEARRDAGRVRGLFNRVSGRAAQDDERLRRLDDADHRLDEQRDQALEPLREQHRQEQAELEEAHRHESDEFERDVEQARERGEFPEHARLTRDAPGHDQGQGGQGRGRE